MSQPGEHQDQGCDTKKHTRRLYYAFTLVVVGVVLDQITKLIAIKYLMERAPIYFFDGWFRLQYATNTGAFLSLGSNLPEGARFWVLTAFNAIILGGVGLYLILKRQVSFTVTLSLSLILSGGIGNLIDRVFRDGTVIDFMNLGIGNARFPIIDLPIRTGIFNIADVAIMAGLFILIIHEVFLRPPPQVTTQE